MSSPDSLEAFVPRARDERTTLFSAAKRRAKRANTHTQVHHGVNEHGHPTQTYVHVRKNHNGTTTRHETHLVQDKHGRFVKPKHGVTHKRHLDAHEANQFHHGDEHAKKQMLKPHHNKDHERMNKHEQAAAAHGVHDDPHPHNAASANEHFRIGPSGVTKVPNGLQQSWITKDKGHYYKTIVSVFRPPNGPNSPICRSIKHYVHENGTWVPIGFRQSVLAHARGTREAQREHWLDPKRHVQAGEEEQIWDTEYHDGPQGKTKTRTRIWRDEHGQLHKSVQVFVMNAQGHFVEDPKHSTTHALPGHIQSTHHATEEGHVKPHGHHIAAHADKRAEQEGDHHASGPARRPSHSKPNRKRHDSAHSPPPKHASGHTKGHH